MTLPSGFFEVFGRPARESACECERSSGMMLGPVMKLVNGPTIADAIADPQNAITKLVASQPDDAKVVDELFLRILARPATPAEIEAGTAALQAGGDELTKFQADLAEHEATSPAKQAAWEATQLPPSWSPVEITDMKSSVDATFAKQADDSVLVEGANGKGTYTITLQTDLPTVTAIRLETLADDRLPSRGPGRAPNGNSCSPSCSPRPRPRPIPSKASRAAAGPRQADFNQEGYPVSYAIDGNPASGWAIAPQFGKDHDARVRSHARREVRRRHHAGAHARPAVRRDAHDRQVPRVGHVSPHAAEHAQRAGQHRGHRWPLPPSSAAMPRRPSSRRTTVRSTPSGTG